MNLKNRIVIAASLGLAIAVGACRVFLATPAAPDRSSATGATSSNSLLPATFHHYEKKLAVVLAEPLTDGGSQLGPDWGGILDDSAGDAPDAGERQKLVRFVLGCALSNGQSALSYPSTSIDGGFDAGSDNFLTSAGGWWDAGLCPLGDAGLAADASAQPCQDVYTCLAARVNPNGEVRIWVDGQGTEHYVDPLDAGPDGAPFSVIEAGWQAIVDGNGKVTITVWPSPPPTCPAYTSPPVGRLCGEHPEACGFDAGTGTCVEIDTGVLTCTGANDAGQVFETRLSCANWCASFDAGVADSGPPCSCSCP